MARANSVWIGESEFWSLGLLRVVSECEVRGAGIVWGHPHLSTTPILSKIHILFKRLENIKEEIASRMSVKRKAPNFVHCNGWEREEGNSEKHQRSSSSLFIKRVLCLKFKAQFWNPSQIQVVFLRMKWLNLHVLSFGFHLVLNYSEYDPPSLFFIFPLFLQLSDIHWNFSGSRDLTNWPGMYWDACSDLFCSRLEYQHLIRTNTNI